jgi:hypothetical protein
MSRLRPVFFSHRQTRVSTSWLDKEAVMIFCTNCTHDDLHRLQQDLRHGPQWPLDIAVVVFV